MPSKRGLTLSVGPSLSLPQVVPLANLIVKETLTEEDVLTCQKTVYNLVDMERKNDPLPISTVGSRGKGPKRYTAAHSGVCVCVCVNVCMSHS